MIQNFEKLIDKELFTLMNSNIHRFIPFGRNISMHGRQVFIPQAGFMALDSQGIKTWLSSIGYQKLMFPSISDPAPSYISDVYVKTHPTNSPNFGRSPVICICLMTQEALELLGHIHDNADVESPSFDGATWRFNTTLDCLYRSLKMAADRYKRNLDLTIAESKSHWEVRLAEAVATEQSKTAEAVKELEVLKKQLEQATAKPKRAPVARGRTKTTA